MEPDSNIVFDLANRLISYLYEYTLMRSALKTIQICSVVKQPQLPMSRVSGASASGEVLSWLFRDHYSSLACTVLGFTFGIFQKRGWTPAAFTRAGMLVRAFSITFFTRLDKIRQTQKPTFLMQFSKWKMWRMPPTYLCFNGLTHRLLKLGQHLSHTQKSFRSLLHFYLKIISRGFHSYKVITAKGL